MLSSRELLAKTSSSQGPILVDLEGVILEGHHLAGDAEPPGLVVGPVTEAVKSFGDGSVLLDVDRDTLWAVEGLLLDEEVLRDVGEFMGSAETLIEAVIGAGHRWRLA